MFRRALVGLWATCVFFIPTIATAASTPYTGTPARIPGQIGAESFDNGGEGIAYHDTTLGNIGGHARATDVDIETSSEGGYDVGWIAAGEWLNYTVTVQSPGTYSVQLRVASPSGASMHAGFNGPSSVWSVVSIPATGGWQNWTTVTLPVTLGAGMQIMTLRFDTGGMNLHDTRVTSTSLTSLPAPWSSQDVGSTGLAGSASFASGLFTVTGAGADIWGTTDAFRFVSRTATGDAQIVARVTSLLNTNTYAKAGVMFRNTLAAGSAHVLLDVRPNGSIEFMSRTATDAATTFLGGGTQPPPAWLRLTRSGNTFTGELSPDGARWTLVGTTNVALAANALVGLAVTGHSATRRDTGTFDSVALTLAPAAPALYSAIADRTAYAKPALPQLGAAGFTFNDPLFGSKILRVTDGATRPGVANRSFRVPSNAHLAAWNATSTAFYVESNDGTIIPYSFNPTTMTAARLQPTGTGNGGATLAFYVEPQFSILNPNIIYGVSGSNNRTVAQFDFSTGTYTTILDLDTMVSGLANTYVGGLNSGGTPETLLTFFGGASQDAHYYALFAPIANLGGRKLLNTVTSTINGNPTSTLLNFHLHSVSMDKGGRYVFLYPTGVDLASPRLAAQVYLWDTASDAITAITADMHPGGHGVSEYGYWVNQDCCTSSAWDAGQWQFRSLTAVAQTSDLISPIQAVKEVYLADHTSWNNAQPDALVPVISATYRYGDNTAAWRAWDDEIIGIQTAGGIGGIVWRFAHHRSNVASDTNPTTPYFWYEPIANVSPDGKWVLFTSNWEKTLGQDSANDSSGAGAFRQDVFVVQLTPQP